jgi:iron complex transport system permease protein
VHLNIDTEHKKPQLIGRSALKFGVIVLFFCVGSFLSLFYGGSESIHFDNSFDDNFIFWQIRLPKTLTAIIAGGSLAASGLILQVIFRNPLAGPYVLGISSGASLAVALGVLAGNGFDFFTDILIGRSFLVASAIAGSLAVTLLILAVSKNVKSNVILLLIGLMFSQICGALQMALEYFSDPNNLKSFVVWGMGSLSNTNNKDLFVFAPIVVFCIIVLFLFVKPLNAMLLGQNYAHNVGIDFNRNRFYLILLSSVLTGVTTAFCGPIAFVGIAVPILSRLFFDTSNQQLHLFSSLFIGSIILLFSDALCNHLITDISLPINMITTFIGAPLVIYLMFKHKQW